jgi:hypothetical protein
VRALRDLEAVVFGDPGVVDVAVRLSERLLELLVVDVGNALEEQQQQRCSSGRSRRRDGPACPHVVPHAGDVTGDSLKRLPDVRAAPAPRIRRSS